MISKITNHAEQARARLLNQFKGKPKFEALINLMAHQFQQLEDAFWQLLTERQITTAVGAQLDIIGEIIGLKREVDETTTLTDDEDYRAMMFIKILANVSEGTLDELIVLVTELLGHEDVVVTEYYPASGEVEVLQEITEFEALLHRLFGQAIPVATYWVIRTLTSSLATSLTCVDFFTTLNGPASSGAGSITVILATHFPATGDLIIDAGLAVEEVVTYSSHVGAVFTLTGTLANSHTDGASVSSYVAADGDDKSLGDEADPDVGGTLTSAVVAKGWV